MKEIVSVLMLGVSLSGGVALAEPAAKYPALRVSIRCLALDPQSGRPTSAGRFVRLDGIAMSENQIEYTVSAGQGDGSEVDYSSAVATPSPGLFLAQGDVAKVEISVLPEALASFESPSRMEPFYIDYSFDSELFDRHAHFRAKCLHRIF